LIERRPNERFNLKPLNDTFQAPPSPFSPRPTLSFYTSFPSAFLMSQARVLIVEDETLEATAIKRRLKENGYIVASVVATGPEVLQAALSQNPDVVLTDIRLKGPMDGITAAEKIREKSSVPLIYLTDSADDELLQRAKVTEPYGYILKSSGDREFNICIEAALYRQRVGEEVRRINRTLEHRDGQLEAANKELETFSHSISHDLRAPLRAIDGFSRALLNDYRDKLDEEGRQNLNRIVAAAKRMSDMVEGMLALSRVTRKEMRYETVDMSALARGVAADLRQSDPERAVAFQIEEGLSVEGDAGLLRSAMQNLLGNAWKFTSKKSPARIDFGARRDENGPVYFVRDDGAGFDMEYADKLFGTFQRLHSLEEFPGTGVGLAMVKRIVNRHGGRVWAEASPEKGAAFYFTLSRNT
jgi:two-component system, sensor histidine kinase and response regulator